MDKVQLGRTDLMVTSVCFSASGLGDMPDGYGVREARAAPRSSYFFTSGQVDCDSGWKASSAGMVAMSL
jgi:hypothetical protein